MSVDYAQIAVGVSTFLAPFTPYLVAGGKKFAEEAGKSAWEKAQVLWQTLADPSGGDGKIQTAARTLATDPQDEDFQRLLAKALALRLSSDESLAHRVLEIMGGPQAVQKVLAERSSWVEDITQDMAGGGEQSVKAKNDSVIKGVKQLKK